MLKHNDKSGYREMEFNNVVECFIRSIEEKVIQPKYIQGFVVNFESK